MTKKALFGTLLLILLFFGLGMFFGMRLQLKPTLSPVATTEQADFSQTNYEAAKKQVAEENPAVGTLFEMQAKTRQGKIKNISTNAITLTNTQPADSASASSTDLVVNIASDTKIFKLTQKDCMQYQKEMEDFQKRKQEMQIAGTEVVPQQRIAVPQLQEKKEVPLADLKDGQFLLVTSGDAIGDKAEFIAKEIVVQNMD